MAEKHECRTLPDRFSKRHLCLVCGKEFVEKNSERKEALTELYQLIMGGVDGEGFEILSSDAIIVYINEQLKNIK